MKVAPAPGSLRIPELGPSLGKLISGTNRVPGGIALDDIRVQLVSRVLDAAGEARRLNASHERAAAIETVGPSLWHEAWQAAVTSTADRLVQRSDAYLTAEARAAGVPRRRRRQFLLNDSERHMLQRRLGASGAPLVQALDVMEMKALEALAPRGAERGALDAWEDALRLVARRLEAAWLGLEDALEAEVLRRRAIGDEIAANKRSLWPVFVFGTIGVIVAGWLGLVLGGYIDSPQWFSELWSVVFP